MQGTVCRKCAFVRYSCLSPQLEAALYFQARSTAQEAEEDSRPLRLLRAEFLDRRQSGDAIRAFDCLTATSDRVDMKWILCHAAQKCSYLNQLEFADWINRLQMDASDLCLAKAGVASCICRAAVVAGQDIPPTLPSCSPESTMLNT